MPHWPFQNQKWPLWRILADTGSKRGDLQSTARGSQRAARHSNSHTRWPAPVLRILSPARTTPSAGPVPVGQSGEKSILKICTFLFLCSCGFHSRGEPILSFFKSLPVTFVTIGELARALCFAYSNLHVTCVTIVELARAFPILPFIELARYICNNGRAW